MPTLSSTCPSAGSPRARTYRLVEGPGMPHLYLDDCYASVEEAWTDALRWWRSCRGACPGGCTLGVEVSTAVGEWRTLWLRPCRRACQAAAPSPRRS